MIRTYEQTCNKLNFHSPAAGPCVNLILVDVQQYHFLTKSSDYTLILHGEKLSKNSDFEVEDSRKCLASPSSATLLLHPYLRQSKEHLADTEILLSKAWMKVYEPYRCCIFSLGSIQRLREDEVALCQQ